MLLRAAAGRVAGRASPARRLTSWAASWGEADRHDGWRGANWGGNVRWVGAPLEEPSSLPELQELIARSTRVRAIGSAHSFTPIVSAGPKADPSVTLVSLRKMPRSVRRRILNSGNPHI